MSQKSTMASLPTPHDHVFKTAMADVRVAKEFFELRLKQEVQAIVDLSTLELQETSFVDDALKNTASDLLYRAALRMPSKKSGRVGYLYILTEQQTSWDRWLPLRIFLYIARILDRHRKQYPKMKVLPVVIPLIFYTGKQKRESQGMDCMDFFELFGEHQQIAQNMLMGPYPLIHLHAMEDQDIIRHQWVGLLEMAMKHAPGQNGVALWKQIVRSTIIGPLIQAGADSYILSVLNYMLHVSDIPNVQSFVDTIRVDVHHDMGDKLMTGAEQLMRKGMQQGMQQGIQQGIQQGMERGSKTARQEIAKALIKSGMQRRFVAQVTGLAIQEL